MVLPRKVTKRPFTLGKAVVVAIGITSGALLLHFVYTQASSSYIRQKALNVLPEVGLSYIHTQKSIPKCSRGVPPQMTRTFCCEGSFHCKHTDGAPGGQVIPCSKCGPPSSSTATDLALVLGGKPRAHGSKWLLSISTRPSFTEHREPRVCSCAG
jgi:hypothetical protein